MPKKKVVGKGEDSERSYQKKKLSDKLSKGEENTDRGGACGGNFLKSPGAEKNPWEKSTEEDDV